MTPLYHMNKNGRTYFTHKDKKDVGAFTAYPIVRPSHCLFPNKQPS